MTLSSQFPELNPAQRKMLLNDLLGVVDEQIVKHCYFDQEYKNRGITIPVDELRAAIRTYVGEEVLQSDE